MHLLRNDHNIEVYDDDWIKVLELARNYGWTPLCSIAPHDWNEPLDEGYVHSMFNLSGPWDGAYEDPFGQIVGEHDAARIAKALEKALDDVSIKDPIFYTLEEVATFAKNGAFVVNN